MIVKLPTEYHLECLSLKGSYTGSSESTHVKIPHCWKSHALAHYSFDQTVHISKLKWALPRMTYVIAILPKNGFATWKFSLHVIVILSLV